MDRQGDRQERWQGEGWVTSREDRRVAGREGGSRVVCRQGVEGRVGPALSSALTRLVPLPHHHTGHTPGHTPGHYTLTIQKDTIP